MAKIRDVFDKCGTEIIRWFGPWLYGIDTFEDFEELEWKIAGIHSQLLQWNNREFNPLTAMFLCLN